jgi:Fe-S cluster assembly protein SufD
MSNIQPIKTAAEIALAEAFGAAKDSLPGSATVRAQRAKAFSAFDAKGLPHRRVEAWKYTDLRAMMRDAKPLAVAPDAAALARAAADGGLFAEVDAIRVVIVDGHYAASLSHGGDLPDGLLIRSLADALSTGDVIASSVAAAQDNAAMMLNAAFMSDGAVINVAPGAVIDRPVLVTVVHTASSPQAVYARVMVSVGDGASLTLVESYQGPAGVAHQSNIVVDLELGDGATVQRIAAQTENLETLHLSSVAVDLGADATFRSFALSAGSAMARNQLFVRYSGEGAHATLSGATMLGGHRHSDTTLVVDHAMPGGESRELFKTVVDGEARSVFQGKIIVQPHAQKTDGQMMNQAIMLSEGGEVYAKPELEIFADDVVCAHGATCGALDEDLLFYLKARGLPPKDAEALLVKAFLGEAIETVEHEGLRDALVAASVRWLGDRV